MNNKKSIAYICGQMLGVIIAMCIAALIIGITIAFIGRLF